MRYSLLEYVLVLFIGCILIIKLFDRLRHAEAIETMRRHRINFNLLYDYNPRKFLSNIGNFVRTISSPEHITLLVSDLR